MAGKSPIAQLLDFGSAARNWRVRIFATTWLCYAGYYLCRKNLSVLMPMLTEDLGFSRTDLAWMLTGYSLIYMLGQFANGLLSDRFGSRLIVAVGLLISVGSNVAMGFGVALQLFLIMSWTNGYGQSTGWPSLIKNMSAWFRKEERGVVMAWWCTCYVVGGFFATILATWLATSDMLFSDLGWRRAFWGPGLLLTAIGAVYVVLARDRPGDADVPPDDGPEAPSPPGKEAQQHGGKAVLMEVLSDSALWAAGSMYFFTKLTRYAFLFWLPLYMTEALSYSDSAAGYTSSVYELVGILGVLASGYVSDRLFQARRFPVGSLMLYGLAVALLLHPTMAEFGMAANAISIGVIGILTFGPDSLMSGAAAMDIGSERGAATAAGLINAMGSAGQLISPLLVAYVANQFGWNAMFYLFVVFSLVSGTILATKWNYGPARDSAG